MNYINSWTESFREWLAYKIFPEFDIYLEVARRVGEIDENRRCIKALQEADSACEGWAVETITVKSKLSEIMKELEKEYGETPF
jgi:hypothetical protein